MTNTPEDNIVLLILMIVVSAVLLCVIVRAILAENEDKRIYKVLYYCDETHMWRTHSAGMSFEEANDTILFLKKKNNDMQCEIAIDTFVGVP